MQAKQCGICQYAERLKKTPRPHKCYKNHTGSAKAMEASVAVEVINKLKEKGADVRLVITDEDSSMMKNIHEKSQKEMELLNGQIQTI